MVKFRFKDGIIIYKNRILGNFKIKEKEKKVMIKANDNKAYWSIIKPHKSKIYGYWEEYIGSVYADAYAMENNRHIFYIFDEFGISNIIAIFSKEYTVK